jgi:hypothetical protein
MIRTVFDVGDAHVRLQAPEAWPTLEPRGTRVILHDPAASSAIFVEPLANVGDPTAWIARLADGGRRITALQRSSAPEAFRLVVSFTSRGVPIERAYWIERVPSQRVKSGVWVAASVDLDGDRKRGRLLGAVFPRGAPAPQLSGESGVRQYIEDDQRAADGSSQGPGFTVRLPSAHSVRQATSSGFEIVVGDNPVGTLAITPCASGDLTIEMPNARDATEAEAFLKRARRGLRVWDDDFRGYWQRPPRVDWTDWALPPPTPSPPPAPKPQSAAPAPARSPSLPPAPVDDLVTVWDSRLRGRVLDYSSTGSSGYDARFSFRSYRQSRIVLHDTHQVEWSETVHTSASYGGLYIGGPVHTRRSGRWRVEAEGNATRLVLYCGSDGGVHRFQLGLTGSGDVTLDGLRHRVARM